MSTSGLFSSGCSWLVVVFCVVTSFQEMLEALKALSVFFSENSLRTRRNLRGDIERRSLSINEEFARIFKDVKEVSKATSLAKVFCAPVGLLCCVPPARPFGWIYKHHLWWTLPIWKWLWKYIKRVLYIKLCALYIDIVMTRWYHLLTTIVLKDSLPNGFWNRLEGLITLTPGGIICLL